MRGGALLKNIGKQTENLASGAKDKYMGSERFFKNMILLAVLIAIAVPTTMAGVLEQRLDEVNATMEQLRAEKAHLEEIQAQQHEPETVPSETQLAQGMSGTILCEGIYYQELYPDFYADTPLDSTIRKEQVVYLTFDDGPSERTPEILKILREAGIKATFFVTAAENEQEKQYLRDIVADGHTLGMHSYSHDMISIYSSVESYLDDMYLLFSQIEEIAGETPTIIRFPGGSVNNYNRGVYQEIIAEMIRRGFVPYDWNISSQDTAGAFRFARELTDNVVAQADKVSRGIVLLHDVDTNALLVEALPSIIEQL